MFGIGAGEFVIILIVGLIVFGPSKLPEVGRAIGKGLREFRKAQAALSQTLNEVDETPKPSPPADKPPVKPLTTESFIGDKPATVAQPTTQPATADTSQVTVDDVIKSAKDNPLAKENQHEKISDGNPVDAANDVARTSSAGARSSSNGVDKQP